MSPKSSKDVAAVPLSPAFFHILLTVREGPSHGYAIMKAVRERTHGTVKLGPGSLYWAIQRLVDAGLLAEAKTKEADARRRSYQLTRYGRTVLKQELEVLADIVSYAVDREWIERPEPTS